MAATAEPVGAVLATARRILVGFGAFRDLQRTGEETQQTLPRVAFSRGVGDRTAAERHHHSHYRMENLADDGRVGEAKNMTRARIDDVLEAMREVLLEQALRRNVGQRERGPH